MTLPASPPITLQQIQDEFLAPRGTSLTSFYRGGAYVPNSPANAGVPTSGSIGTLGFLGATRQSVAIANASVTAVAVSPADSTATYTLNSNGLIQSTRNGGTTTDGTWLLGGTASAFYVVATLQSGALDSGTTGTPLNLGSTHSWTRVRTANTSGTNSAQLVLQIYDVATNSLQS